MAGTVDNPVEHDTDDEQGDETEDYPAPVMEYKVTGADDEYITNHDHSSQRYVFVFIDNSGDNIRSARTSVRRESNADAAATERCSDDTCHERLVVQ